MPEPSGENRNIFYGDFSMGVKYIVDFFKKAKNKISSFLIVLSVMKEIKQVNVKVIE